jgi:hypothetical protein
MQIPDLAGAFESASVLSQRAKIAIEERKLGHAQDLLGSIPKRPIGPRVNRPIDRSISI